MAPRATPRRRTQRIVSAAVWNMLVLVVGVGAYACEPTTSSYPRNGSAVEDPVDAAAPARDDEALPPPADGGAPPPTLPTSAFKSAQVCASCHQSIVTQWSGSMHSRSLTSPLMIAETNQGVRGPYAAVPDPDPKRFCVNCHAPSAARVSTSPSIPLGDDSTLWKEGLTCQGCHQFNGAAASGGGGLSTAYMKGLQPGNTVFGPLADPAPSKAHASARSDAFDRPNTMCGNCHNVNLDLNGDGKIEKGTDLVLQQTWDEYVTDYKAVGGTGTCISCHMPVVTALKKVTDGVESKAPDREVHDHSFRGVDYALDDAAQRTATRASRTALLRSAATLVIEPGTLTANATTTNLRVTVTNTNTGHNLPTGFAFVRQMWLEVRALSNGGNVLASSGLLPTAASDLCDNDLISDTSNPLSTLIADCDGADRSLVSFQQKLVSAVELARDPAGNIVKDQLGQPLIRAANGSREVLLQLLPGGVVARKRPVDGVTLGLLRPFEARSFNYALATNGATARRVSVRLLFRNTPPYFVRGLAVGQPQDVPGLATMVNNLEVIEMAAVEMNVPN